MARVKVHISRRKRAAGFTYAVVWEDPRTGALRTESVGTRKAMAQAVAAERRRMLQNGQIAGIKAITYDDFVTEHLDEIEGQLSAGSCREHVRVLQQFKQACNPKTLTVIDYAMLQRFRSARVKDGVTPATVNLCLRTLQGILERAVMHNYIAVNPFKGKAKALKAKEPEKVVNVMPEKEFIAALDACPNDTWRAIFTVAYHGGLRRGELVHLEWEDINFESRELHVLNKDEHPTKSRKPRTVPMNGDVMKALAALRGGMFPGGYVFRNLRGRAMYNNFGSNFERIVKRAGLIDSKGKARYSAHDLRGTCVTNLLDRGVSPKIVQVIMGHASITTTMKHYAGVSDKGKHEAMKRLESGA